jgi:ATP-dependent RNA helicase RhlE
MGPGSAPGTAFSGPVERSRRSPRGAKAPEREEKREPKREGQREGRRESQRGEPRRESRAPVRPAQPKLPKLDFDPSKPYESKAPPAAAAAEPKRHSHRKSARPVAALLGGVPPKPDDV